MNVRNFTYEGFDSVAQAQILEAFDVPHIIQPIAAPAPRPTFSTEELELAKTLAREEGLRDGQELAKKSFEEEKNSNAALEAASNQRMLEEINIKLATLNEEGQNSRNKFSERMGQLALAIAEKVCGDVAGEVIEKQILQIINESVAKVDAGDKIKIHLNPRNARSLNDKFTNAAVVIDEKLELGDFRLEWQNGFAERDVKKLWETIAEICSRHSSLEENEIVTEQTKGE